MKKWAITTSTSSWTSTAATSWAWWRTERRNARLENELRKAHLIIDVQGKVAGLLGISLDDGTNS